MRKTQFIVIEQDNAEVVITSGIKNDYEQQLDCDYIQTFNEEREGETPIKYEVTITVKRIGKLKDT